MESFKARSNLTSKSENALSFRFKCENYLGSLLKLQIHFAVASSTPRPRFWNRRSGTKPRRASFHSTLPPPVQWFRGTSSGKYIWDGVSSICHYLFLLPWPEAGFHLTSENIEKDAPWINSRKQTIWWNLFSTVPSLYSHSFVHPLIHPSMYSTSLNCVLGFRVNKPESQGGEGFWLGI